MFARPNPIVWQIISCRVVNISLQVSMVSVHGPTVLRNLLVIGLFIPRWRGQGKGGSEEPRTSILLSIVLLSKPVPTLCYL